MNSQAEILDKLADVLKRDEMRNKVLWEGTWNANGMTQNIPEMQNYETVKVICSGWGNISVILVNNGNGHFYGAAGYQGSGHNYTVGIGLLCNGATVSFKDTWVPSGIAHLQSSNHSARTVLPPIKIVGLEPLRIEGASLKAVLLTMLQRFCFTPKVGCAI